MSLGDSHRSCAILFRTDGRIHPKSLEGKSRVNSTEKTKQPVLLKGGNPQVDKGDGEQVVFGYIEAMPGWKQEVGRALHAIIVREVPDVVTKVRWNTPFYGKDDGTSFVAFHCLSRYVKVTFFKGTELNPMPNETSTQPSVRYVHIHEPGQFDQSLVADWVRQASTIPGQRI